MQIVDNSLMAVVLNPATLKFSDPALEHDYTTHRSLGSLLTAELNFSFLNAAMYLLFIAPEFISGKFHLDAPHLLKLLGMALVACQYTLTTHLSTASWLKHRLSLVAGFRSARLAVFLLSGPLWITGGSVSPGVLLKTALLRTGFAVNVWYALGMPLLFEEHLILQSIHVIVTAYVTSPPTCALLLDTPDARSLFKHLWTSVDQLLMTLAGLSDVQTQTSDDRWALGCERLLLVMHVLFSLALPSLLLWKLEVASRVRYVQEQNQLGHRHINLDCSWLPDTGRLVVFCVVSTSAYWALFAGV